jgi:pSer/pThr/pTyr-binding forkhead associated (FHA) protein
MEQGWALKSLGTNGTYVDNKRISEMPVKDGMIIRLARSGPNIQIHTTEEKRDPLQELLSNRRKTAIDMDEGETRSARESVSTELPNQTTVIP